MVAGLGLLALGAVSKYGQGAMNDAREERKIAEFSRAAQGMQSGLDLSADDGIRQLALRQITDPRMIQYGNQQLSQAMERGQQNKQWEWGNNNLTKAQQENLALSKAGQAADIWEGQQRVSQGWDQNAIQRAAQARAQENELWARENMTPFQQAQMQQAQQQSTLPDLEGITKQTNYYRDKVQTSLKPYQEQVGAYNAAMGVINNPDASPLDYAAAVTSFAKAFDPTSTVSTPEGMVIREGAGGFVDTLRQQIAAASKGGMTDKTRAAMNSTLSAMIEQRASDAESATNYWRGNMQADPVIIDPRSGKPMIDPEVLLGGINLKPTAKWKKQGNAPVSDADIAEMARKQGLDLGNFKVLGRD